MWNASEQTDDNDMDSNDDIGFRDTEDTNDDKQFKIENVLKTMGKLAEIPLINWIKECTWNVNKKQGSFGVKTILYRGINSGVLVLPGNGHSQLQC